MAAHLFLLGSHGILPRVAEDEEIELSGEAECGQLLPHRLEIGAPGRRGLFVDRHQHRRARDDRRPRLRQGETGRQPSETPSQEPEQSVTGGPGDPQRRQRKEHERRRIRRTETVRRQSPGGQRQHRERAQQRRGQSDAAPQADQTETVEKPGQYRSSLGYAVH